MDIHDRIDKRIQDKIDKYLSSGRVQDVSFREWCKEWTWAKRSDVYTHYIHSYPAKLLPYVPICFLASTLSGEDETILDCFAGTGTVLLEALVHHTKPRNSYGIDINPLARLIAKVKTTLIQPERLKDAASLLFNIIKKNHLAPIPVFDNIDFWFRPGAINDLAKIKHAIDTLDVSVNERDFFLVCFSSIIRDASRADPFIAPPIILKTSNFPKNRKKEITNIVNKKQHSSPIGLFEKRVNQNINRMISLHLELNGRQTQKKATIIWDDARDIKMGKYISSGRLKKENPRALDNKIGLVITSPPYMSAQKYIRSTRLELSWLGLVPIEEINQIDRKIIGTERITQNETKELRPIGISIADKMLKRVFNINPTRYAIASNYYNEMKLSLNSIYKVLRPKGTCIIVVGNNNVCGIEAKNHIVLSELAAENRMFKTKTILRDSIASRGMITKRHATGGVIDDEYVLLLEKQ